MVDQDFTPTVRDIPAACAAELRAYILGVRATGEIVTHPPHAGCDMIEEQIRTILGRHSVEDVRPLVEFDERTKRLRVWFVSGDGRDLLLRGASTP